MTGAAPSAALERLTRELDLWATAGASAMLWLRDDDAVAPTPALETLAALTASLQVPALIAAISAEATAALAAFVAAQPDWAVGVHGYSHANHAPAGVKSAEFPPERGEAAIRAEIAAARDRLHALFGSALLPIYVPPWNRITPEVAALLPALDFTALSTFGERPVLDDAARLAEINTHVDIIDWRRGRAGRPVDVLADELTAALGQSRRGARHAVGVLTHHLVHDALAWRSLETLLAATVAHPGCDWVSPRALVPMR